MYFLLCILYQSLRTPKCANQEALVHQCLRLAQSVDQQFSQVIFLISNLGCLNGTQIVDSNSLEQSLNFLARPCFSSHAARFSVGPH